jgi:hypothetical protein
LEGELDCYSYPKIEKGERKEKDERESQGKRRGEGQERIDKGKNGM